MNALLRIEMIKMKREIMSFFLSIGLPVLFFLLFSSVGISGGDEEKLQQAIRNYLVTMTAFSMSGFGLFTFPLMLQEDRQSNWLLQITHMPLPLWKYYLAKVIQVMFSFVIAIIINLVVGIVVKNLSFTLSELIGMSILLLYGGILYLAIGLLLAQIKSQQLISLVGNLAYFVLAIFGGSWIPVRFFPEWMKQISYLTPTYHANQLVLLFLENQRISGKSLLIVTFYAIICTGVALGLKRRLELK